MNPEQQSTAGPVKVKVQDSTLLRMVKKHPWEMSIMKTTTDEK